MAEGRFKRIAGILKGVAPTAVAGLAGPYAPLVAGVMRKVLKVERDEELEAAVLAAASDPEQTIKLKEIEAAMQAQEAELGIKFEELAVRDRESARELAKATTLWPQIILGGLYTIAYLAVLMIFITGNATVDADHAGMVNSLLGALGAVQIQILTFFFGSSSGSARKTEIVARRES